MGALDVEKLYQYVGDLSQVFYAREYRMIGGRADGLRAVDIANGKSLALTVLIDRCLDIGGLSFRSVNCAHISKSGYIHPGYYDANGTNALRTFTAGFLTTCGLKNVGPRVVMDGVEYPVHGGVGNYPAENVSVSAELEGRPHICIKGSVRQADFLRDNIWLHREIRVMLDADEIMINDSIENRGFKEVPLMLLYHFNLGYPLLDEHARFITSATFLRSKYEISDDEMRERYAFPAPIEGCPERVFYYSSQGVADGKSFAGLINKEKRIGTVIWSDPTELPMLVHWRNPRAGDYVMGIEPSNCFADGIQEQKKHGLEILGPRQVKKVHLTVEFAGRERINQLSGMAVYD